eukprot:1158916-Pelagomonas_calceolata.AAC.3
MAWQTNSDAHVLDMILHAISPGEDDRRRNVGLAMRTALHLRQYDDIINPVEAFIKLESMPSIPAEDRSKYADLGMSIFMKPEYSPKDPATLRETRDRGRAAPTPNAPGLDGLLDDLVRPKDQVRWQGKLGEMKEFQELCNYGMMCHPSSRH